MRFPFKDFQGLLPALDRKRIAEPHVVDGRNFAVTTDGPVSAYARSEISHKALKFPEAIQTFSLSTTLIYYMTREGIFIHDLDSDQMIPQLLIATPGTPPEPHPWSTANCGGKRYFARQGIGLVERDPDTNTFTVLTGGSIPTGIVACTQSNSRLIVLAEGVVAWSAIDDGRDFVPSPDTGAGFQALSIINSLCQCSPLMLLEYVSGVLVYTTQGILRMEAVDSIIPFRMKVISRKHVPINDFCVIEVGQYQHVMLTEAGFFATEKGQIPQLWEPVMSEFFHLSLVPKLDISIPAVVRLATDFDRQVFAVSTSPEQFPGQYTKSYILYLPSGKWGSFDRPHTGLINIYSGTNVGFQWGYCDTEGSIFEFYGGANDLIQDSPNNDIWYEQFRKDVAYPAFIFNEAGSDIAYMPAVGFLDTNVDGSGMRALDVAGLYNRRKIIQSRDSIGTAIAETPTQDVGGEWHLICDLVETVTLQHVLLGRETALLENIDSWIEIGLFRAGENLDIAELTQFHEAGIGMSAVALRETTEDYIEDYIELPNDVEEDYANVSVAVSEDWGVGDASASRYSASARASNDGYETWRPGEDEELQEADLVSYLEDGRMIFYTVDLVGLYHILKFETVDAGDQYHLKTIDLNLEPAGYLF